MNGSAGGQAGAGGARRRRSWGQRLVLVVGSLTVMAFAGAAVTLGLASDKLEQIPRVELSHVLADDTTAGQARNVLIVGVDSSAGLDEDDPVQNQRDPNSMLADTIMVLRLDPESGQAAILSFPRDLLVTFPGTMSQDRINSSIWRGDGSPDVLIELLASNFGIPIHNYVQVDFAGFKDVIETLGGIDVYFEHPGRDKHTGLYVYDTGCVHLNADRALAYARSRYYDDYINGRWRRQLDSDLGRIRRQQDVMRRIADKAVDLGVRDAGILYGLAGDAIGSVTVDNSLSVGGIVEVAEQFRSFDPQATLTYTLPVEPGTLGAMSIVRLKEYEAEPILQIFRDAPETDDEAEVDTDGEDESDGNAGTAGEGGIDPDDLVAPEQIAVAVENGSGISGQATEAGDELVAAGFSVISYDNAERFGLDQTEIRYPRSRSNEAANLASWLVSGAELVEDSSADGLILVTGTDWDGVLSEPRLADSPDDDPADADTDTDTDANADEDADEDQDDLGLETTTTSDTTVATSSSTTELPTTTTPTTTTSTTIEPTNEPGPAC